MPRGCWMWTTSFWKPVGGRRACQQLGLSKRGPLHYPALPACLVGPAGSGPVPVPGGGRLGPLGTPPFGVFLPRAQGLGAGVTEARRCGGSVLLVKLFGQ